MSNYTQNVSYGPKDALTQGDPNKAILGTQIDAELSEISTAIASKEDAANKGQPSGYAPLNSSTLLADSYLTSNIPRLNATATFTGSVVSVSGTNAQVRIIESDGAANEGTWIWQNDVGSLTLRAYNDALTSFNTAIQFERTGFVVDSITFTATGLTLTGAITLTGAVVTSSTVQVGTSIELGHATDTTLSRVSAGVVAIEGANIATVSQAQTISAAWTINAAWNFATAPQVASLELGHATDTTLTRVSAGVVAIEGSNILKESTGMKQGLATIPIMAAAMQPAVTNGAASASVETASGTLYKTLDFDQTTQEFAGFNIPIPRSWNDGTFTFQPIWTFASGTGGVVWAVQGVTIGDGTTIATAFGTEQVSIDTALTAGQLHVGPESAAITVAGTPSEGQLLFFRIKRNPAHASDTLTGDARLIGVRLYFTQNSADDTL